jgi:hypothetical protein
MTGKTVLAIGLDPIFADYSQMPGLTPALVSAYIDAQIEGLRTSGYAVESCLVDLGETAEQTVAAVLGARAYDCIVIGAGLREPPARLLLFEKILNLVHRLAPDACIAFNTSPADTAEAVRRWIG